MVLYREQKRRSAWFWVGLVGLFVALLAIVAIVLGILSRPSDEERLADAVKLMTAQLDVLVVSHYTAQTMEVGESSPEYGAAVEDVRRIRDEWVKVDNLVDQATAQDTIARIDQLAALVNQLAPVADVSARAEELAGLLTTLKIAN